MSSKEEILKLWQQHHGALTPFEQERFLAKCDEPDIRELLDIPPLALNSALGSKKKLNEVLLEARRIIDERKSHKPKLPKAKSPSPQSPSGQAYVQRQTTETAPPRPGKQKPTQSPPSGNPGASAPYYSGMVRNPGTPEASIGDRCDHCGAHIPDGAMHDKCRG